MAAKQFHFDEQLISGRLRGKRIPDHVHFEDLIACQCVVSQPQSGHSTDRFNVYEMKQLRFFQARYFEIMGELLRNTVSLQFIRNLASVACYLSLIRIWYIFKFKTRHIVVLPVHVFVQNNFLLHPNPCWKFLKEINKN